MAKKKAAPKEPKFKIFKGEYYTIGGDKTDAIKGVLKVAKSGPGDNILLTAPVASNERQIARARTKSIFRATITPKRRRISR